MMQGFGVFEIRSPNGEGWWIPATERTSVAAILEKLLRQESANIQGPDYIRVRFRPFMATPENYDDY